MMVSEEVKQEILAAIEDDGAMPYQPYVCFMGIYEDRRFFYTTDGVGTIDRFEFVEDSLASRRAMADKLISATKKSLN